VEEKTPARPGDDPVWIILNNKGTVYSVTVTIFQIPDYALKENT
jgi:hypothetical protein